MMQKTVVELGKLAKFASYCGAIIARWPEVYQYRKYTTTQRNQLMDPYSKFKDLTSITGAKKILITGSLGQLGYGLATTLRKIYGNDMVIMTDIVKAQKDEKCEPFYYLNILNQSAIDQIVVNHNIDTIIHFSALLSAVGEANVPLALKVNAEGVQNILEVAKQHKTQIFIPSSIGAFGPTAPLDNTPDLCVQRPRTIYGVTKVYAELLGEYYSERFDVDFRSLRFPGIISVTQPGGGTTDYAVQIFYDALTSGKHKCYLRQNSQLPMMYYADCITSIISYLSAPAEKLTYRTYNVTGYSFTPEEIAAAIRKVMPNFEIEYEICPIRQKIADSWPKSLDDTSARKDWNWRPLYDLQATVDMMFDLVKRQLISEGKNITA
uniref:L-threonine 3-dehydrogenase, mitochondrial n=1 Tax=Elaeophora elaphi TaxID=1147741 RepID=A0A0R3RSV0_9BILA